MTSLPAVTTAFSGLPEGFFKSVSGSVIEQLIWRYNSELKRIHQVHEAVHSPEMAAAVDYFLRGARDKHHESHTGFSSLDQAIKVLDADFWQMAFSATDLNDHMPENRRREWREAIDSRSVPAFELETVVTTLKELLLERDKFLAERVEGIFRALSGEHVTNVPEGFSKRMIMYIGDRYTSVTLSAAGHIADLRHVIAHFMGNLPPGRYDTDVMLTRCAKYPGVWNEIDGGALRVKTFKKGTAHMEIHPDFAWRLNQILAFLHPRAIPPKFRKRPEKKTKSFSLTMNLIPTDVRSAIGKMEQKAIMKGDGVRRHRIGWEPGVFELRYRFSMDKHVVEKVVQVLEACGGEHWGHGEFFFPYDFNEIKDHLVIHGTIPDQKAHQYYATPHALAERMVHWADIDDHHTCLEPSAGQGNIACLMPGHVKAIEVSELHCKILRKKGVTNVMCEDFLAWVKGAPLVQRVVMNPPFSQGRAEAHISAAAGLLEKNGILVALVPASIRNKKEIPGFVYEWEEVKREDFAGVSVDMALVKMTRREYA